MQSRPRPRSAPAPRPAAGGMPAGCTARYHAAARPAEVPVPGLSGRRRPPEAPTGHAARSLSWLLGTPTRPPGLVPRGRPSPARWAAGPDCGTTDGASISLPCKLQRRGLAAASLEPQVEAPSPPAASAGHGGECLLQLAVQLDDASACWVLERWLAARPRLLPALLPRLDRCSSVAARCAESQPLGPASAGGPCGAAALGSPGSGGHAPRETPSAGRPPTPPGAQSSAADVADDRARDRGPPPLSEPGLHTADFSGKLNVRAWSAEGVQGWHEIHLEADGSCRWLEFTMVDGASGCRFDEECKQRGTWTVGGTCRANAVAMVTWADGSEQTASLEGCLIRPDQKWPPGHSCLPC